MLLNRMKALPPSEYLRFQCDPQQKSRGSSQHKRIKNGVCNMSTRSARFPGLALPILDIIRNLNTALCISWNIISILDMMFQERCKVHCWDCGLGSLVLYNRHFFQSKGGNT
jgi:hypothetical protein